MSITKRLKATIASGFALAAAPQTEGWKPRRPAVSPAFDPQPASDRPPARAPAAPETKAQSPGGAPAPRDLLVFASGFVLAAAAAAGLWLLAGAGLPSLPGKMKATVARLQPSVPLEQQATCNVEPATPVTGEADGRFPLHASVTGLVAADIASLIVIGNEAAATGRPRDAESAYLMSCRVADKLKGAGSGELADAKYQLGAHYARLVLGGSVAAGTDRAELLRRAEPMYLDSLHASVALRGEAHEKSQLAAQGLAALRQTAAKGKSAQPAPATASATAALPIPAPERVTGSGASQQLPASVQLPAASPIPRPPSMTAAEIQTPQDLPASKPCPDAVAALGLCNPGP